MEKQKIGNRKSKKNPKNYVKNHENFQQIFYIYVFHSQTDKQIEKILIDKMNVCQKNLSSI